MPFLFEVFEPMSAQEKLNVSWIDTEGKTRRVFAISSVISLVVVVLLFYSDIADFLSAHPLWQDFLVALPAIALPILAWFQLGHFAEANRLRTVADDLRREENRLQEQIGQLMARLLEQAASNTQTPQAGKNAEILRKYIGACVSVLEGRGSWPGTPLIVEVSDANIVTLFTPSAGSSLPAWCVKVHCGDLEIAEIPYGSCPLKLKVLKRFGPDVHLGEITKWEDRMHPTAAATIFNKGGYVYHATFSKQGSAETRRLYVYASADDTNSFLLEASTGERVVADNVEVSKRFMLLDVDYESTGFTRSGSGTSGDSRYRLFIR
jgi:hypothetical protein